MAVSENARRLKEIRDRAGLSVRGLARLIGWGHTRVQYYEDEYKDELLPQKIVKLIAPHLIGKGSPAITEAEVFMLAGMAPTASPHTPKVQEPSTVSMPIDSAPLLPHRADMPKDVPVLGTSVGGAAGDFSMNGEVHDYVRRPPGLADRKDVFACWVSGESMLPWRRPRELVYVERNRRPVIGDHVIVEFKAEGDDVRPAYVKRLVRQSATKIIVEQYNPPKQLEYDARKVHHIYRVMEWSEVLGLSL